MRKHFKLGLSVIVLFSIILLHLVPVDSRTGYLINPTYQTELCVGPTQIQDFNYRWINGGVNAWDNDLSNLREVPRNKLPPSLLGCAQPAHFRLYIL